MILKHEIVVDLPIPFFLLSQIKTAEDEDEHEEWGVRKLQERETGKSGFEEVPEI